MYRKANTDQIKFAIDWIMTVAPSQKINITKSPTTKPFCQ